MGLPAKPVLFDALLNICSTHYKSVNPHMEHVIHPILTYCPLPTGYLGLPGELPMRRSQNNLFLPPLFRRRGPEIVR